MENGKNAQEALQEVVEELKDYALRLTAFKEENAEYIAHLDAIGEAANWDIKPFDPQDAQRADAFIARIEESDAEDTVKDFDKIKYSFDIAHQFRVFSTEGLVLRRRLTVARLALCIEIIEAFEGWVKNAQNAMAEGDYDANLPDAIKTIEQRIVGFQQEKAQFELELAATNPNKLN